MADFKQTDLGKNISLFEDTHCENVNQLTDSDFKEKIETWKSFIEERNDSSKKFEEDFLNHPVMETTLLEKKIKGFWEPNSSVTFESTDLEQKNKKVEFSTFHENIFDKNTFDTSRKINNFEENETEEDPNKPTQRLEEKGKITLMNLNYHEATNETNKNEIARNETNKNEIGRNEINRNEIARNETNRNEIENKGQSIGENSSEIEDRNLLIDKKYVKTEHRDHSIETEDKDQSIGRNYNKIEDKGSLVDKNPIESHPKSLISKNTNLTSNIHADDKDKNNNKNIRDIENSKFSHLSLVNKRTIFSDNDTSIHNEVDSNSTKKIKYMNGTIPYDPTEELVENLENKIKHLNSQILNYKMALDNKDNTIKALNLQIELLKAEDYEFERRYLEKCVSKGLEVIEEIMKMEKPRDMTHDVTALKLENLTLKNIVEELALRLDESKNAKILDD